MVRLGKVWFGYLRLSGVSLTNKHARQIKKLRNNDHNLYILRSQKILSEKVTTA